MATPSSTPARGSVFLSYRREDTKHLAGRIYDRLIERFPRTNVFMDVDSIEPGADFGEAIERAIASCDILLVLIGERWLDAQDQDGRSRLDDPDDFVVLEIAAALRRGIRVLPVLVDGAQQPRAARLPPVLEPLARRNSMRLDHERFRSDLETLVAAIARVLQEVSSEPQGVSPRLVRVELLDTHNEHKTVWTVRLTLGDRSYSITFDHDTNTELLVQVDGRLVVNQRVIVTLQRSSVAEFKLDDGTDVRATVHFTWTLGRITHVEFLIDGARAVVQ